MIAALFCVLTLGWWILLGISLERDRSRYWNCYLLFIALVSTLWTVTFLAGMYQIPLLLGLFVLFTTAILIVPFFLKVLLLDNQPRTLLLCS